jgi:hypothetical protein
MTQTYLITFKGKGIDKLGDMSKDIAKELELEGLCLPKEISIDVRRIE